MHEYPLRLRWQGSTSQAYPLELEAQGTGKPPIPVGAAETHGGDPARWSPEDLLGASLSSCHLLTFLALAKKVRLDVRRYDERATVTLDDTEKVARVSKIVLSPTIRVAPGTDTAKVREMFEKAHKYCFIAQSLKAEVVLDPRILEEPMGD